MQYMLAYLRGYADLAENETVTHMKYIEREDVFHMNHCFVEVMHMKYNASLKCKEYYKACKEYYKPLC